MENHRPRLAKAMLISVLFGVGTYMLLLSAIAPVVSDDIWLPGGMDGKGLQDLSDVARSCVGLYDKYNIRLGNIAYFWILFFGRWLFVVLNPVVYLTLGLLVFIMALGRGPDPKSIRDVTLLLFIYLLIGGAAPAITEVSFWGNGAVQYLWGCAAVFGFLVPFRFLLEGKVVIPDTKENTALVLVAGVLVGRATETIVPAAIFLIALSWIVSYRKEEKPPLWFYAGLSGLCGSFLLFALAPGNFSRAATANAEALWDMSLFDRLIVVTPHLFRKFVVYSGRHVVQMLEITIAVGVVILLLDSLKKKRNQFLALWDRRFALALIFLTAAGLTIFSFFVVPVKMSSRVYFGAGIMIIVSMVIAVRVLFYDVYPVAAKYFIGVVGFLCFMEMAAIAKEYVDIRPQYQQRMAIIEQARASRLKSVRLPKYQRQRRQHIWLRDITADPNSAENKVIAWRWGFEEVIGFEAQDNNRSQ